MAEKKDKYGELLLWLPLIIFAGFAVFFPTGIYSDTAQYIAMHIHRDPLYPFFLFLLRSLSGGAEWYLKLAVWIQNILAGISVTLLVKTIKKEFGLNGLLTTLVCLLALAPHIVTPLVSSSRLILSNSIMSESLTLPLFYFFTAQMIKSLREFSYKHLTLALVFGLLLSLIRGQMTVMLIVWIITAVYMAIVSKIDSHAGQPGTSTDGSHAGQRFALVKKIAILFVCFALAVGLKGLLTKSYNLIFNNYFTGTGMSSVSMLTNILYASDMDESLIDEEDVKEYYQAAAEKADELGYNYKYADGGFINRALILDTVHDKIKFECLDELWRTMHDSNPRYQFDYEYEGMEQDRLAKVIISDIWPECLGTWLYDYLALAAVGFIRTVAFVNPVMNIYALLVYLIWIGLTVFLTVTYLKRKKTVPALDEETAEKEKRKKLTIRFALFSILAVCANVFGTATVIMCLSRYMVYTLPLVYISLLINLAALLEYRKK